jgi:8-amino-7-oxononanoate synthase
MNRFAKKLETLQSHNRLRKLSLPGGIDFSSNDYLGFRAHPALRETAIEALQNGLDLGAGGSRLLRGHTAQHADLETYAAQYFAAEKSLYFSCGYQANAAIFQALPGRHDTIIFDEFVHASARESIQNSPAKHIRVRHSDLQGFEEALKAAHSKRKPEEMIWLAAESVYSMDGDIAPVQALLELAEQFNAMLILDEAHGTGVMGPRGKGVAESMNHQHLITLHTCGKALGVAGGLVCGPAVMIDTLINTARAFIYSTAPMPLQALLTHKALELLASEDGQMRLQKLKSLSTKGQQLFGGPGTPIVPIILGSDSRAVEMARALQQAGYDVRAIRPPTVPEGTARLRLTLGVHQDENMLQTLAKILSPLLQQEAA